jgi:membrane associated rhomboid family serine protease
MPPYPNRYSGGRGFGGGGGFSLAFPPFRGVVRTLVLINAAVFFLVLFGNIATSGFGGTINQIFGLVPVFVLHGWLWQLISYGFIHVGIGHILVNMLMLWMFGSTLEGGWGRSRFLQLYFFAMIGAALTTIGVGYLGYGIAQSQFANGGMVSPFWRSLAGLLQTPTIGASGAVYGVLVAFGILYADQELFMFPIPFRIKAKYMTIILVVVVLASALQPGSSGVANFAHLGGLFFGWVFVRFVPQRGLGFSVSEQYYGIRNSYYRWKRRRAARKFEVYMRQQDRQLDRSKYFDEYGNYRDPKSSPKSGDKGNGEGRGPWVN